MSNEQTETAGSAGSQLSGAELLTKIERDQREIAERKRKGLPTAQDTFNAMVKNELSPALRALGFKGSGRVFRMSLGSHLAAVDIQSSAWNSALEVRFTMNIAVVERATWAASQDPSRNSDRFFTPNNVSPGPGRARVGVLATGDDHWWSVTAGALTQPITTEVLRDLTNYALPWIRARADTVLD